MQESSEVISLMSSPSRGCGTGNIDACPYYRCRAEIAKWLSIKMRYITL
jgi:hypothetical protein